MRVLLVSANTERIKMTSLPLGLGMVATAVRQAGHETVFLDLLSEADPIAAVRRTVADFSPQVTAEMTANQVYEALCATQP